MLGVREASAILSGEFITTSEESHSLDKSFRKHVKGSGQRSRGPDTFLLYCVVRRMVAFRTRSQDWDKPKGLTGSVRMGRRLPLAVSQRQL